MSRRLEKGRLIAATHNLGKVAELKDLFEPLGFSVMSAAELQLPEPDETEFTFIGNALLKARAACEATGATALSDDSGIAVEALGGMPRVNTADWAGEPRDFYRAMEKVERLLRGNEDDNRKAKFVCTLAVVWPDGHEEVFEGETHGTLTWPPRGEMGFGFDPVFVPVGRTETFAELKPEEKHAMSHRADAFRKLKAALL